MAASGPTCFSGPTGVEGFPGAPQLVISTAFTLSGSGIAADT